MVRIVVTTREAETWQIVAASGKSVMEAIRDEGVGEMLALCGGCCSCATCHVYIAPEWASRLPPMSDDENDLLGGSSDRRTTSRLSCQLSIVPELDGLVVTIAAED